MGQWVKSLNLRSCNASLLETLLENYQKRDFQVRLWDGTTSGGQKTSHDSFWFSRTQESCARCF